MAKSKIKNKFPLNLYLFNEKKRERRTTRSTKPNTELPTLQMARYVCVGMMPCIIIITHNTFHLFAATKYGTESVTKCAYISVMRGRRCNRKATN